MPALQLSERTLLRDDDFSRYRVYNMNLLCIQKEVEMSPFPTCKITVLKTLYHEDLAEEYRHPYLDNGPCKFFNVGDEFIVKYLTERRTTREF